jgi:hypothetical protein
MAANAAATSYSPAPGSYVRMGMGILPHDKLLVNKSFLLLKNRLLIFKAMY